MSLPTGSAQPEVEDLRGVLTGRLVVLEPLDARHEEGLRRAAAEGDVFRWLPVDLGAGEEAVSEWLKGSLAAARARREVPFATVEASSGRVLGSTRFLELRLEHLRVEVGWTWLARSAWSTGVNVEAKLLLLTRAFERVGLRRVEFKTDARNERSRGALAAAGASFEGILRKHMVVRDGAPRDSAYFSVIDDEWPAVKRGLEERLRGFSGVGQ